MCCVQQVSICFDAYEGGNNWETFGERLEKLPPIAQVCRQIRQEILPMYCDLQRFEAYADVDKERAHTPALAQKLHAWLVYIGPEYARLIKHLAIKMPLPQCMCSWRDQYCGNDCGAWIRSLLKMSGPTSSCRISASRRQ